MSSVLRSRAKNWICFDEVVGCACIKTSSHSCSCPHSRSNALIRYRNQRSGEQCPSDSSSCDLPHQSRDATELWHIRPSNVALTELAAFPWGNGHVEHYMSRSGLHLLVWILASGGAVYGQTAPKAMATVLYRGNDARKGEKIGSCEKVDCRAHRA